MIVENGREEKGTRSRLKASDGLKIKVKLLFRATIIGAYNNY